MGVVFNRGKVWASASKNNQIGLIVPQIEATCGYDVISKMIKTRPVVPEKKVTSCYEIINGLTVMNFYSNQ
jgi:hypothetical protein